MAHEAWKKLEESFEGTKAIKGAKAYILKEKFVSFKMEECARHVSSDGSICQ